MSTPLASIMQYTSSPSTPGTPITPEKKDSKESTNAKKGQKRSIDEVENAAADSENMNPQISIPQTFKLNTNVANTENGTSFWNRVGCGIADADSVRSNRIWCEFDKVQTQSKKSKKKEKFPFPKLNGLNSKNGIK